MLIRSLDSRSAQVSWTCTDLAQSRLFVLVLSKKQAKILKNLFLTWLSKFSISLWEMLQTERLLHKNMHQTPTDPFFLWHAYTHFVITAIFYFLEGRSGNLGGHWHKIYNNMLESFLPVAHNQLIGVITAYVKEWSPEELRFSFRSTALPVDGASVNLESTREVLVTYVSFSLTSVFSKWFEKFIFKKLGKIWDCYLTEYFSSITLVFLLENNTRRAFTFSTKLH